MPRIFIRAVVMSVIGAAPAVANPLALSPNGSSTPVQAAAPQEQTVRYAAAAQRNLGGGFLEAIFGGQPQQQYYREPSYVPGGSYDRQQRYQYQYDQGLNPPGSAFGGPGRGPYGEPARPGMDPRYERQVVMYDGKEPAGTIVIDTPRRFLYLVQGDGRALRYGIGVGRPGFSWAGVKSITRKAEWPGWTPPPEMLKRRPDLPRHMVGGPDNPLGARAMYLGSSLYRIHGSNEPWTIGQAVSSGCIRMRNEDVIDLYGRVKVGTRVVII